MNRYMGETWQTWWFPKVSQTAVRNKRGFILKKTFLYSTWHPFRRHLLARQLETLAGTFAVGHTSHIHKAGPSCTFIKDPCGTWAADEWVFAGRQCEITRLLFFIAISAKHYPLAHTSRFLRDRMPIRCHPDWQLPSKSTSLATFSIVVFPFLLVFPQAPSLTSISFLHVIYFYFTSQRSGEELRSRVEH